MSHYVTFFFIDAGTGCTHLFAFDRQAGEWRIPCGQIPKPTRADVTYAPTRSMCKRCVRLTEPKITREPYPVPRTHHR